MKTREMPQINLRVAPEVKEKVLSEAKRNRRSLNAEIGILMEEALNARAKQSAA
jgi:hypothetical protein